MSEPLIISFGDDYEQHAFGDCHFLTVSLARLTGWRPVTLNDTRICGGWASWIEEFGALLHSAVITPSGHLVDAHGVRPIENDGCAVTYSDFPDSVHWRPEINAEIDDLIAILPEPVDERMARARLVASAVIERIADMMNELNTSAPSSSFIPDDEIPW